MQLYTHTAKIAYQDALYYYKRLNSSQATFIFESSNGSDHSSRMSLVGTDPILELTGKNDVCEVKLLADRGTAFFNYLCKNFKDQGTLTSDTSLKIEIVKAPFKGDENQRFKRQNIGQIIRQFLLEFELNQKNFMGLYGALSYNFIYLYEDVVKEKENDTADFHLFLFDNILMFNHLMQQATVYCTRQDEVAAAEAVAELLMHFKAADEQEYRMPLVSDFEFTPSDETFMKQVEYARQLCLEGELMETVFCRKITANIEGDTLPLYENYRAINPSPYMFHFDFGNEILLGTSPEVMVRYENGKVILRPISGTIGRGKSVLEDHNNMIQLLTDPKEKAELDMLIDLGRNDLSKVCKPGVQIENYRVIEKYSHVMHTVAQVAGELQDDKIGLDALVACLNAGTLTGAPKVRAMQAIEETEEHTRGYYGGCVGYFLLNGEVNTGIIIRTAYVKDNELSYCSGATLLYESDPEKELIETNFKAQAFLKNLEKFTAKETEKVV